MCIIVVCVFFFFKQKTAYEMRISDWSSDVCSSDLHHHPAAGARRAPRRKAQRQRRLRAFINHHQISPHRPRPLNVLCARAKLRHIRMKGKRGPLDLDPVYAYGEGESRNGRSEEHTSELQSLLRISYAVFCLKKKQQHNT